MPVPDLVKVNTALISVYDKKGLPELASALFEVTPGIFVLSSGGTADAIRDLGYVVIDVHDYTGFPESPSGLVKTLHPKIHGGILLNPYSESGEHMSFMVSNGIRSVDLVVVNFYPFEEAADRNADLEEARKYIDIGGHAMIRGAAKNSSRVAAVAYPEDYQKLIDDLRQHDGHTTRSTREYLALRAFERTAAYDQAIVAYLKRHAARTPSH
jgi:phosphoribosylaminoimidazolecarboxamide formyltransferase/IMP cyclohydrolase